MSTIWLINQYGTPPSIGMHARQHYLGRALAAAGHDVYVIAVVYF